MKTVTVKLPDAEAKKLDMFVKKKNYVSKSEFIRNLIMEKMGDSQKEKFGWLVVAEKSLNKLWNNKKDVEVWSKYL